jgi:anti-sigma regulatory factor (Ser/Thr protein kinase)
MARVTRTFAADQVQLSSVRAFVRQHAVESSFSVVADDLVLAANEACANSITHSKSSRFAVSVASEGARIEIEIRDQGVFLRRVPIPELDGEGHRGLQLIMAMMDEVTIAAGREDEPGTVVRLVRYKPVRARGAPTKDHKEIERADSE